MEVLQIPGPSTRAPLVFLHEGLGSVAIWQGRAGDWPAQVCQATGRAGWVYSRRGYGQSPAIPDVRSSGRLGADYMHREAWEVLPSLLKDWGIEKPVLIGHSDGGTIALLHAAQFPLAGCVVMAPHLMVEDMTLSAIEAAKKLTKREIYAKSCRGTTPMWTALFGNGTMSGCRRRSEALIFAKNAKPLQRQCWRCKAQMTRMAVCVT